MKNDWFLCWGRWLCVFRHRFFLGIEWNLWQRNLLAKWEFFFFPLFRNIFGIQPSVESILFFKNNKKTIAVRRISTQLNGGQHHQTTTTTTIYSFNTHTREDSAADDFRSVCDKSNISYVLLHVDVVLLYWEREISGGCFIFFFATPTSYLAWQSWLLVYQ